MGRKYFEARALRTLSEAYPTREAYESGLLLSERTRSRNPDLGSDSLFPVSAPTPPEKRGRPAGCHLAHEREGQTACEFADYCNHRYTVESTCCCKEAWKKRAGLALPVDL
jgi:hypothetical protein